MTSINRLREGLEERIQKRINKLKTRKAYYYFITHIDYLQKTKKLNKTAIHKSLKKIEDNIPNIKDLIKSVRKFIPHIWDQTQISSVYLLIGKAFSNLETALILAKIGHNLEIIELARSGHEAIDLAFLFLEDNEGKYYRKWFKGKIIANEKARKSFQKAIIQEIRNNPNKSQGILPVEDVKRDIYSIYSLYTHSSYAALLDAIDVFYEDYDFNRNAGFYYTLKNLHAIDSLAVNILLGLKNTFVKCNDLQSILQVDKLLKAVGHSDMSKEEIRSVLKKYLY